MDEDTDLADPNILSKNGGLPHKTHSSRPDDGKEGKPDPTSKLLDDNITTDKIKADKPVPQKPVENRTGTDQDGGTTSIPKLSPGLPTDATSSEPEESNQLEDREEKRIPTQTPFRSSTSTPSMPSVSVENGIVIDKEGDLVRGSDGKLYRFHRGPPGPRGPTGKPVSTIISSVTVMSTVINFI